MLVKCIIIHFEKNLWVFSWFWNSFFIQKIGIGLSVQFLGVLLSLSGYKSSTNCLSSLEDLDQPLTAIITIRLCMGLIPSFLVIAGLIAMNPWRSLDLKSRRLSQWITLPDGSEDFLAVF